MSPWLGWIGGWAICVTGVLVVGSLADVAARYTYLFLGLDGLAGSKVAITLFAAIIIVAMTALCVIGTEISARVQDIMIVAQVGALLLLAVAACFGCSPARPPRAGSSRSAPGSRPSRSIAPAS